MRNTLDAIKYGLETLNITPKDMFSLIESSNGYEGDDYKRWLSNEIIKIAEKDGILYSQLLAKWFNIIQSIIEEYADESVKDSYKNKILSMIANSKNYTVGVPEEEGYGEPVDEIDWGSKVDLHCNLDFIDTLPEEMGEYIREDKGVTIFVRFNPKNAFKKNSDLVFDAKINGVSVKNQDALMMYRMCTIARALDDMCSNFKFVFMTDTKFLYDKENESVVNYFLSFFKYNGFVVNSKDLYSGSFTSEEYAICECTLRGIGDPIQGGFVLKEGVDVEGEITLSGKEKRYSSGSNMLDALYKKYPSDEYTDNIPMLNRSNKVVGKTVGLRDALGYLCKGANDRSAILTSFPLEDTKYIAITEGNLKDIIAYYGVSQAMDNAGMFMGIDEIIDGHPEYSNLVSNCVSLFLFDINSKFCDLGTISGGSGKEYRLVNKLDVSSSEIVKKLLDESAVYFSYETKELMEVCKGFLDYFTENCGEDMTGKTFEEIRKEANNDNLNRVYLNNLSRCKDYVSSIYRLM